MSIASGYKKFKKYILTSSGFQLVSHWTKANTLEFDDGKTAQDKLGAIDGISSSRESNSDKIAASTALVSELNSDLANGQIEFDLQGGKGVYRQKGADAWLPFSNTLVLMDGTASAAFSGINVTRYSTFVLNNFDYSNYSKIRITNLGPYGYQVTCGTQLITADGTYDVSSLASDKLQVLYRGDTVNPNIMLRIELIP